MTDQFVHRTTGDAIVDGLLAHHVDTVFGIPGVQTYALYDALARVGEQIRVFGARHEQGAAYMAFGYAQATGRPGVFSVVPGPGVLNAGAAMLSAYGASAPVVCLTSEIPTAYIGRGLGHLHEMPDQLATLRTFTKWAANIEHPALAAGLVADAFHHATSGRPRPVALATPWDVLSRSAPCPPCVPRAAEAVPIDGALVEQAAALLAGAVNPMIMVGSGARGAVDEVRALADALQAPVVSFRGGRGIVSERDAHGFTLAEGFERWRQSDVVVGIGTRLELAWFRWPGRPDGQRTILIDIDPAQLVRLAPAIGIVGDAASATRALVDELGSALSRPIASRADELAEIKRRAHADVATLQPHADYLRAIRDVLPDNGFFVEEVSQIGFASYFAFPIYEPRTFVTCGHQGTLGFGFPTALGVKAGQPDRAVVSIAGDGGFLFGVQELATAVQERLGVVTIVFDNGAYGNVMNDQRRLFDGRVIGSELRNPDFVALARAFGAHGEQASNPDELRRVLDVSLSRAEPTVISVPMPLDAAASPWRFLMPQLPRDGR